MACENVKECPCEKTDCENYKKCCACITRHRERDYLPACFRERFEKKPNLPELSPEQK